MNFFRKLAELDSRAHGALTLGAMLAVVLGVLSVSSLNLYGRLVSTLGVRTALVRAEGELYRLTTAQYNEEAELRAYAASRGSRPYIGTGDDFDSGLRRLGELTAPLGSAQVNASVRRLGDVHKQWARTVAEPVLRDPGRADTPEMLTAAKLVAESQRTESARMQSLLDASLDAAQRDITLMSTQILAAGMLSLLFFGTFGVLFVGLRTRMLNRIRRERAIIETLQGAFRASMEPIPGARLGTAYTSATADAAVGGDVFDTWPLDDHRGLVLIADISGKGLDAAVNTALVKYAVRTLSSTTDAPDAILAGFNRVFMQTIKDPCLFVAMFVGVIDTRAMTLSYASAGHSGAFVRRGARVDELPVTGPLIGLDRSFAFSAGAYVLERGDLLVLATDGFTEARTATGRMLSDGEMRGFVQGAGADPQACADKLIAAVRRHSGGKLSDDLALMVLSIDGAAASGALPSSSAAA